MNESTSRAFLMSPIFFHSTTCMMSAAPIQSNKFSSFDAVHSVPSASFPHAEVNCLRSLLLALLTSCFYSPSSPNPPSSLNLPWMQLEQRDSWLKQKAGQTRDSWLKKNLSWTLWNPFKTLWRARKVPRWPSLTWTDCHWLSLTFTDSHLVWLTLKHSQSLSAVTHALWKMRCLSDAKVFQSMQQAE